jgi:hypothetical protein
MAKSFLNMAGYPLGLRNNNPGNVRSNDPWKGMISQNQGFAVFENIAWGLRAMAKSIIHEFNVGNDTVAKLIYEWAPPIENDTEAYISNVISSTDYGRNQTLTATNETLLRLMRAIMKVELGGSFAALITDADINEGLALIDGGEVTPEVAEAGFGFAGILLVTAVIYAISTYKKSRKLRRKIYRGRA